MGARALGFGVALWSADGSLDLREAVAPTGAGVFAAAGVGLGMGAEASDMGGDGGSWTWTLASGGVVISGELAVESASPSVFLSKVGDPSAERSVEIVDRCRASCFLILSWSTSVSILRSDSSSRRRCASMRSFSRSCSPIFVSSSINTARSMAWLYLDSRSSNDEVVLRACRSKSSFATSMSRSLCCRVLLDSRSVVISFSRAFWAVFASALDSLYFL